jgi:hypothetical protein
MIIKCKSCNRTWDYKGKSLTFAHCKCNNKVRLLTMKYKITSMENKRQRMVKKLNERKRS